MRMKTLALPGAILAVTLAVAACGDDDGGNNQNVGQDASTQHDAATQTDAAVQPDAAAPGCGTMCALFATCGNVADATELIGTSENECNTSCEGSLAGYARDCLLAATTCGELEGCTACQTWDDIGFCSETDGACDLLVNHCGGSDYSQCTIDCEMYGSGAAGCFHGAGRICWEQAADAQSCELMAACPTIH